VCLIHDDLLATGGTTAACLRLVRKFNPRKVYVSFLIDLVDCPRTADFSGGEEVFSVLEVFENPV